MCAAGYLHPTDVRSPHSRLLPGVSAPPSPLQPSPAWSDLSLAQSEYFDALESLDEPVRVPYMPLDLVELILAQAAEDEGRDQLKTVALVCRDWSTIARKLSVLALTPARMSVVSSLAGRLTVSAFSGTSLGQS